jgi:hypothetical protein
MENFSHGIMTRSHSSARSPAGHGIYGQAIAATRFWHLTSAIAAIVRSDGI